MSQWVLCLDQEGLGQDSIHSGGARTSLRTRAGISGFWYAKKPSVSGRSAECAAFISEFYVLHKNPTQPVTKEDVFVSLCSCESGGSVKIDQRSAGIHIITKTTTCSAMTNVRELCRNDPRPSARSLAHAIHAAGVGLGTPATTTAACQLGHHDDGHRHHD
jgi:hypothetical protein